MSLDTLMLIAILFGAVAAVMAFQFSLDGDEMGVRSGVQNHHTFDKATTNGLLVFALFIACAVAFGSTVRNLL